MDIKNNHTYIPENPGLPPSFDCENRRKLIAKIDEMIALLDHHEETLNRLEQATISYL